MDWLELFKEEGLIALVLYVMLYINPVAGTFYEKLVVALMILLILVVRGVVKEKKREE